MIVEVITAIRLILFNNDGKSTTTKVIPVGARGEVLGVDERNLAFFYVKFDEHESPLRLVSDGHFRTISPLEILASAANEDTP